MGSGGGKVVLVRGEAGIGKTSLVREFLNRHVDEAHVLSGSCDDLSTPQPLGPFWDLARKEPSLGEPLESGDRLRVLAAVLELLSRSLRPSILLIEDTHWADEATLDAIKYLGRRIADTNGLLLLTYREGEVDYDHPLRGVIGEFPPQSIERIRLERLSAPAVASMIGDSGLDLDEVLALADGNPLFVTEVLASGVETVPSSVQDSVLARAAKVSPGARRVLDLVSVIPGEAERALVAEILDPTPAQLSECVRQGLLRVDEDFVSFLHELTRRAIETALSSSDRRRLNQQVLAGLGAETNASRMVHHAREANDVESIVEYAPKAARAAMAIASYREAFAHFRTLEPYLDRVAQADRALIFDDWARTEFYLDNVEALDILAHAIELHRSRGDDVALARALTFGVRLNEINGLPSAADDCAAEAIEILEVYPPSPDLAFAVSQLAWLSLMRGDGARAMRIADRAIDLAAETGDDLTTIHALNTKGSEMYMRGDADGLRLLEEARTLAQEGGYRFEEIRALLNMTSAALERLELELASDLAQRTRNTATRYENRTLEAYSDAQRAQIHCWKGEWVAADDIATEVLGSHPHTDLVVQWVLGRLQTRRGQPDAQLTIDRTWLLAEATGEMQNLLPVAAAYAEYLWVMGENTPSLVERFGEALDEGIRLGSSWPTGDLAFWLWKLGELPQAPDGIAEPYRLMIEGEFSAAAELWSTIGCPYERAITLAQGDRATQLEALDILEGLGAVAVAAKLRKALIDQGVPVPRGRGRKTRAHPVGLTSRQAEVLELLDEALSNTEIADRLFVSPRTVEHHVSAVLRKLDASTREQAVASARAKGLLPASA